MFLLKKKGSKTKKHFSYLSKTSGNSLWIKALPICLWSVWDKELKRCELEFKLSTTNMFTSSKVTVSL